MERQLSSSERPLQIALDCSTSGVASPKFIFKTSLTERAGTKDQESHQTNGFISYVGTMTVHSSLESCNSSRQHSKIIDGELDQSSMNSFGSAASLSSKSSKSKSTSSLNVKSKKKPLGHTWSNQETNSSPNASPLHAAQRRHTHNPHSMASSSPSIQKQSRPKSVMSNFITRSLRVRKKSKLAKSPGPTPSGTPLLTDSDTTLLPDDSDDRVSLLVSPIPMERKFTMSAVMHIYFTEAKQTQVYKSVLVSEKATTQEVIAQALERYNMKFRDPSDFVLYEVIGKWQDITGILPPNMSLQINSRATTSLPGLGLQSASPIVNRRTSVEEFVECYTRELNPEEHPYSAQFFLTTQKGFTRRFELRSKAKMNKNRSESAECMLKTSTSSDPASAVDGALRRQALSFDNTINAQMGIFGQTAHRRRARRHHLAQYSADAADDLSTTLETSILGQVDSSSSLSKQSENCERDDENEQMFKVGSSENSNLRILDQDEEEIPITVNPLHPPDFAALTCSSPDSGVAFQKNSNQVAYSSAKSSVSSEQSEQKSVSSASCGIYKAKLNTAFLLSLHLHSPEKEYLVHKLGSDKTIITSARNEGDSAVTPNFSEINSESRIALHHPDLTSCKHPVCCICRQPIKVSNGDVSDTTHQFVISNVNSNMPLLVNGQPMSSDSVVLRHGDLISIGGAYLFMFQDYSSVHGNYIPDYNWKPLLVEARAGLNIPAVLLANSSQGVAEHITSSTIGVSGTSSRNDPFTSTPHGEHHWHHQKDVSVSSESEISVIIEDMDSNVISVIDTRKVQSKSKSLSPPRIETSASAPQRSKTDPTVKHSNSAHQIVHSHIFETNVESGRELEVGEESEPSQPSSPLKKPSATTTVHTTKFKQICAIPKNRKLVFSFTSNEEDLLLDLVITRHDTVTSTCKLTPSYILAMCVEYSMMCNGQQSAVRFVQKATDRIQEIVWVSVNYL